MNTTLKLTEIVDKWITSLDVLSSTKRDYKRKLNTWFRYLSAHRIEPRSPNRTNVLDYKEWLLTQNYSLYSVNSFICMVRLFYTWCEEQRYCSNIAAGIKLVKQYGDYAKHPLSEQQASALIESFDSKSIVNIRDKLMIGLMLFNGLRTCEVERINIGDFDIIEGEHILNIQRKGRHDKSELVVLHPDLIVWMEDYISRRDYDLSDPLFISHRPRHSSRLTRQSISHIVKRRLRDVGINDPKLTPHSLRHTYGTMLVESGVDIETVRDLMGHSDSKTTRIYVGIAQQRRLLKNSPSKGIFDKINNRN
ncbi:MAG: tyrosine-type recombinase/integrase [Rikenellaceae bacterium]